MPIMNSEQQRISFDMRNLNLSGQVYRTYMELTLGQRGRRGEDSEPNTWSLYICFTINFLTCHVLCAKL